MYRINVRGIVIECDSFDETKRVVDAYKGEMEGPATLPPSLPPPTSQSQKLGGRKRGAGPRKSWIFARWLAEKEGVKPDTARAKIAELRRTDYAKHQALEAEFLADYEAKQTV